MKVIVGHLHVVAQIIPRFRIIRRDRVDKRGMRMIVERCRRRRVRRSALPMDGVLVVEKLHALVVIQAASIQYTIPLK